MKGVQAAVTAPDINPVYCLCDQESPRFGRFEVVVAACQHRFHLDCLAAHFDQTPADRRVCLICQKYPFPLLRQDGSRLCEVSPYCESTAMLACRTGNCELIKSMLQADKNLVVQGFRPANAGETVSLLHVSAFNGHADIVKVLLEAGANPSAYCENGWTPLSAATQLGHESVVNTLLLAGADPNACCSKGWFPLSNAVFEGHEGIVRTLLKFNANPNVYLDGFTPLRLAVEKGFEGIIIMLLEAGANPNCSREDGTMLLHFAVQAGHRELVLALLKAGGKPNLVDQSGETPLMAAVRTGQDQIAGDLIRAGADISCCNREGLSAIAMAALDSREGMVDVLLRAGCRGKVKIEAEEV